MKIFFCLFFLSGCLMAETEAPNQPALYITHWVGDRNGLTFGFQTIPTYKYTILGSTNLNNWYSITNFTATEYSYSIFMSSDAAPFDKKQFFCVKYELPK